MGYKKKARSLAALGNEVFDLSSPTLKTLYDRAAKEASSHVTSNNASNWNEISEGIEKAYTRHGGEGLIILNGSYPHIIGALVKLAQKEIFNIRYIPLDRGQLSEETKIFDATTADYRPIELKELRTEMKNCLDVTKRLGFKNMEILRDFLAQTDNSSHPKMTAIVENITAFHETNTKNPFQKASEKSYGLLTEFVKNSSKKPSFIYFAGEDIHVSGYAYDLNKDRARTLVGRFLVAMKKEKVPVEIGSFGFRDRPLFSQSCDDRKNEEEPVRTANPSALNVTQVLKL